MLGSVGWSARVYFVGSRPIMSVRKVWACMCCWVSCMGDSTGLFDVKIMYVEKSKDKIIIEKNAIVDLFI